MSSTSTGNDTRILDAHATLHLNRSGDPVSVGTAKGTLRIQYAGKQPYIVMDGVRRNVTIMPAHGKKPAKVYVEGQNTQTPKTSKGLSVKQQRVEGYVQEEAFKAQIENEPLGYFQQEALKNRAARAQETVATQAPATSTTAATTAATTNSPPPGSVPTQAPASQAPPTNAPGTSSAPGGTVATQHRRDRTISMTPINANDAGLSALEKLVLAVKITVPSLGGLAVLHRVLGGTWIGGSSELYKILESAKEAKAALNTYTTTKNSQNKAAAETAIDNLSKACKVGEPAVANSEDVQGIMDSRIILRSHAKSVAAAIADLLPKTLNGHDSQAHELLALLDAIEEMGHNPIWLNDHLGNGGIASLWNATSLLDLLSRIPVLGYAVNVPFRLLDTNLEQFSGDQYDRVELARQLLVVKGEVGGGLTPQRAQELVKGVADPSAAAETQLHTDLAAFLATAGATLARAGEMGVGTTTIPEEIRLRAAFATFLATAAATPARAREMSVAIPNNAAEVQLQTDFATFLSPHQGGGTAVRARAIALGAPNTPTEHTVSAALTPVAQGGWGLGLARVLQIVTNPALANATLANEVALQTAVTGTGFTAARVREIDAAIPTGTALAIAAETQLLNGIGTFLATAAVTPTSTPARARQMSLAAPNNAAEVQLQGDFAAFLATAATIPTSTPDRAREMSVAIPNNVAETQLQTDFDTFLVGGTAVRAKELSKGIADSANTNEVVLQRKATTATTKFTAATNPSRNAHYTFAEATGIICEAVA